RVSNLHTTRSLDSAYNSHESPRNPRSPERTGENGSHVDGAVKEPSIKRQDSFEMRLPELPKIDVHYVGDDPVIVEVVKEKQKEPPMWRFIELSFAEWLYVVLGSTSAAIFGSFNPLLGYMIALVVTEYHINESNKHMRNEVDKWCLIIACMGVDTVIANFLQHFYFGIMGGENDIAIGWFDEEENSVDTLSMRLANDATFMRAAFSNRLSIFIQDLIYSYHYGVSDRDDLTVAFSTNDIGHTSDSYSFCHCSGFRYTSIMNTSVIMQQLAFYLIITSSEHFCQKL
ncbi:ABC transporter B family member 6-like protein, partial [Tanacetum coccineum]